MAEKTVPTVSNEQPERACEETRENGRYLRPPVDIHETGEGLAVVADLPGVERDALDLRVEGDVLSIEGRSRSTAPGDPLRGEFHLVDFFREFALPEEIDSDKISAKLEHGVLTVHLPKAEKGKPRQIEVGVN